MKLGSDYFHAMDKKSGDYVSSMSNIGVGTRASGDMLQELKAKIMKGASAVELGFMGRGKGAKSQGNTTPESYGKPEREAMRDLAKVNKVRLTTHATVAAGSWSGFHENRFDEGSRQQNIYEGERAIEFAGDVAQGGAIVVHTGEYPRHISEAPKPGEKSEFSDFTSEKNQKTHYLYYSKTEKL